MPTCPNILLLLTDQMRSTALGCADRERVFTPHLDRLAAEGTRFANAVSNTPACTPARATLFTGKHVLSHGLVQNDMGLGWHHRTLAHALNGAGYDCAYIGKLHVDGRNRGAFIPPGPRRLGFDAFWAGVECNHQYLAGYYYAEDGTPIWFDGYEPDGQTELACNWLRQRPADRPWCQVLSWGPPHCPYGQVPRAFRDLYPPERIERVPNAVGAGIDARHDVPADQQDAFVRQTIANYYAQVSALDACVGRLLETLAETGQADDTIVVFTSDHGDLLFSHNRGWKAKPWRESVGIPLLVRWPGHVPEGRVTRGPIGLVDLMPTLLELAGAPTPAEVEGEDLSAFVLGDESAAPLCEYINFPCMNGTWSVPPWRGVVTRRHTYAESPTGPWLLYDDVADPWQLHNLVGDPAHRRLEHELHGLLRGWLERTGDDFADAATIARRFIPSPNAHHFVDIPPLPPAIADEQRRRVAAWRAAESS